MSASSDAIAAFSTAITAALPLSDASSVTIGALLTQGAAVISTIEAEQATYDAMLDGLDTASLMPQAVVDLVLSSLGASTGQTALADARGLVGRAMRNLEEV